LSREELQLQVKRKGSRILHLLASKKIAQALGQKLDSGKKRRATKYAGRVGEYGRQRRERFHGKRTKYPEKGESAESSRPNMGITKKRASERNCKGTSWPLIPGKEIR